MAPARRPGPGTDLETVMSSSEHDRRVLTALEQELTGDPVLSALARAVAAPIPSRRRSGRTLIGVTLLGATTAVGVTSQHSWLLLVGASLVWAVPELAACLPWPAGG